MKIKNLYKRNKYFLCEYELDVNSPDITAKLWQNKDSLKYVDTKNKDKTIISIADEQVDGFIDVLDKLGIEYSKKEILDLDFNNRSKHTLFDYSNSSIRPYDFQVEDAKKLLTMKRGLIGSEMLTGKSLVAILVGESIKMPKLVICPESLRLNWKKEILQINPLSEVKILRSDDDDISLGKDWTIVGYYTATKFKDELSFDCIFVDECHYIKAINNWGKPTSNRAKTISKLADNSTYCYFITGTPIPSRNKDLYTLLRLLKSKDILKMSFSKYGQRYCDAKSNNFGMDYNGNSNSDELHNILSKVMIRRLRKEVLPNLKKERKFIPLLPKFGRDYLSIEDDLTNGGSYLGCAMSGRRVLSKYKIPDCISLAQTFLDNEESVVIVSEFIDTIKTLQDHFKNNCCVIQGGMSDKAKEQAVQEFQSGNKKVCLVNMIAGGVGITLTKASKVIMIDYDWIPANNSQAEDRICRIGQNEFCEIYYLYCENSIFDQVFINMITSKSENIDRVVDNADNTMNLNQSYLDALKERLKDI